MDSKTKLDDLKVEYLVNSNHLDEVWRYHPSNPNFINPLKIYHPLLQINKKILF